MEKIGKYDRHVSFQVPTTTKTSGGGVQKGFAHSFYAWCGREVISEGNEQYINDRLLTPYRFRYRTHYQVGMNETMRIVDDSVSYNVLSCMPDPRKMFIDLVVEREAG